MGQSANSGSEVTLDHHSLFSNTHFRQIWQSSWTLSLPLELICTLTSVLLICNCFKSRRAGITRQPVPTLCNPLSMSDLKKKKQGSNVTASLVGYSCFQYPRGHVASKHVSTDESLVSEGCKQLNNYRQSINRLWCRNAEDWEEILTLCIQKHATF